MPHSVNLSNFQFASDAAKVWFDELKRNRGSRQLILLYLANDVIQNGKLKGTVSEYVKLRVHYFFLIKKNKLK